jgi:hypothetical protein
MADQRPAPPSLPQVALVIQPGNAPANVGIPGGVAAGPLAGLAPPYAQVNFVAQLQNLDVLQYPPTVVAAMPYIVAPQALPQVKKHMTFGSSTGSSSGEPKCTEYLSPLHVHTQYNRPLSSITISRKQM